MDGLGFDMQFCHGAEKMEASSPGSCVCTEGGGEEREPGAH